MDTQGLGKVFLVDDEPAFCVTTAGLLTREGYQCDTRSSPPEALAELPGDYDVLITDINMPGNAELEFIGEVRRIAPELPIIVVTGYPSVSTAVEAIHLSAVDYLLKPVKVPELCKSVAKAVQRGRLVRAVRYTKTTTDDWGQVMGQLEKAVSWSGETKEKEGDIEWTMDRFLEQSMTHLAKLSSGIQQTLAVAHKDQSVASVNVCDLLSCPRRQRYEGVLHETVAVLEKTKRAFKSKDLGELRKTIEAVLGEDHQA